jgi:hypothetical protein
MDKNLFLCPRAEPWFVLQPRERSFTGKIRNLKFEENKVPGKQVIQVHSSIGFPGENPHGLLAIILAGGGVAGGGACPGSLLLWRKGCAWIPE